MPSCPVHSTAMRQWPSGDWFCPKKVDGEFCDVVIRADGTQDRKKGRTAAPPVAARAPQANGAAAMVNDLRCQAALDFASRIFSGTQDSHSALELARSIVRHWDVTWREP